MEFRVLGPLEVRENGTVLELGGAKQRAVLALLLLQANEVVSLDRLIDGIWGERPPDTAAAAVHGSISRLRKALEPEGAPYRVLQTHAPGYVVTAESEAVDSYRFESLVAEGKDALERGDAVGAARLLSEALGLWRGPALADLAHTITDRTEVDRLEEERLAALEERIDADLALGRQAALVSELETLVTRHPLRERVRGQLMVALYRSGRQAEALEVYRDGTRTLDRELGIAPGPALRELERRILLQDPELAAPRPPAGPSRAPATRRYRLAGAVAALALSALAAVLVLVSLRGDDAAVVERVVPNGIGAIDPATNTLVSSISVGSYPQDLELGEGSVWVANAGDHTVSQIDTDSGRVTTTKGLRGAPVTLNVSRGVVWIGMSHYDQPTSLLRLTGVPNESATDVVELTESPGLVFPVVADGPSGLWVSVRSEPDTFVLTPTGDVHRLDLLPRDCIPVGSGIETGTVWIGCEDGRLVRVDEVTRKRESTTQVGSLLTALAVGADAVWASDIFEDVVWRIDPSTGRPLRTIPVGRAPSGIAVGFGSVWVVNRDSGTVSRIDPRAGRVVATIPVGRDAGAIAIGAGRVWLAVPGEVGETH